MAVDFLHRLIVTGAPSRVSAFRKALKRSVTRSLGSETWRETVSFSFAALYELAPGARRVAPEVPFDPYDISAWPVRRLNARTAEARYKFHTRSLEITGLIRALSRAFPKLTFDVGTMCLGDGSFESYRIVGGVSRKWTMPHKRQEEHWEAARKKFGSLGDEVYENDDARWFAEENMFQEVMMHWDRASRGARRAL